MRQCVVCGCHDDDCSGCVERTGEPCFWVGPGVCSACYPLEVREGRGYRLHPAEALVLLEMRFLAFAELVCEKLGVSLEPDDVVKPPETVYDCPDGTRAGCDCATCRAKRGG